MDYYGRPKLGYHAFKQSMSPLLAAAVYEIKERKPGDPVDISINVINDYHHGFSNLEIEQIFCGETFGKYNTDVQPDSVLKFPAASVTLPVGAIHELPLLKIVARHKGETVSESDYDLSFYDGKRASLPARAFFLTLWKWWTRSKSEV